MNDDYGKVYDVTPESDVLIYTGEGGYDRSVEYLKLLKGKNSDVLLREFTLSDDKRCTLVMVDGMCDKEGIETSVIIAARRYAERSSQNKFDTSDGMLQQFAATEVTEEKSLSKGYIAALTGDLFLLIEGEESGFVFGYRAIESRSVDESPNEGSVRGPHEAFTENIRTNTALLRRRIADPNFVIESATVGTRSHTSVAICYIRGLTNPELIRQVTDRINAVCIDIINDSGELEQLLEDSPNSLFPQIDGSEMPDIIAGELCNGRVAVIVSGSPQVLLIPATLSRLMRVGEDDYQRWSFATFVKLLRWIALIIAIIGPGLYVAIVSFHPGLLPTNLLIISVVNRLNVPFSALTEALILEFSLELLREASIRMPKNISTALSIVGGLIIGDAAINAGLISPLLIIVVGLSTMASFTLPSYSLASSLRLIKYMILFLSGFLGLLGLVAGSIAALSMMVAAQSFNTDFTTPFAPLHRRSVVRGLIEMPMRYRKQRPEYLDPMDIIRYRPPQKARKG